MAVSRTLFLCNLKGIIITWVRRGKLKLKTKLLFKFEPEVGQTDIRAPNESELPRLFMTKEILKKQLPKFPKLDQIVIGETPKFV